ncbi:MAG: restriction endonuclease subunit S [Chloroflexi bacterium]|nr:restriction endonuclease subunit S [Chloroflexota bacterium]
MREGWRHVRIGDVCKVVVDRADPRELVPGTPYVGLEAMPSGSPRIGVTGAVAEVTSQVTRFSPGDTLFGRLRPYLRKVALAGWDGVCSPEILVLRPSRESVIDEFLYLVACADPLTEWAMASSAGSRMPRTSAADLAAFEFDLPPLAEQRRIVDLIGTLGEITDKSRRLAVAVDTAIDALRDETFSQDGTEAHPLRELCSPDGIQIGPFGSQLHASDYVTDGVPVVMPQDMDAGRISVDAIARVPEEHARRLARHRLQPGDILLARRGDLTKRALVGERERDWLCGTGTVRVRVNQGLPEAVFEALSTRDTNVWLIDHAVGITLPNLNTQIVGSIPVRMPLNTATTVDALREMRSVRMLVENHAHVAFLARSALSSDLLTGRHPIPTTYDRFLDGAA